MEGKRQIAHLDDVKLLVDTFYSKVRADALLGPVFDERIKDRWPVHLEKMYTFWQTTLLGEHSYTGRPFPPHATLPVEHKHFERWVALFTQTLDELFTGEKAEEARWRATKIAEMFELKVWHFQNHPGAIQ
ncbi:MAG: group III truncated hemoglobin [Mucilaginibacter sp.]